MHDDDARLYETDSLVDLGHRVVGLLAGGYDGEQIKRLGVTTTEQAEQALRAYAARVLRGTAPPAPAPDCGSISYNGWCFVHGVFHTSPAADEAEPSDTGDEPVVYTTTGSQNEAVLRCTGCPEWEVDADGTGITDSARRAADHIRADHAEVVDTRG